METNACKIDVAVNAPEAGTIKEFLVSEEDTVTVGQDLVKLELGGAPSGDQQGKSEPKEPASEKQDTSSQPEGGKEKEAPKEEKQPEPKKEEPKKEESKPAPPPPQQEKKPAPKKEDKPAPKSTQDQGPFGGNREENRVRIYAQRHGRKY